MMSTMLVNVDKSGRMVLPAEIRRRLDVQGGGRVDLTCLGDTVEIRPAPSDVEVVWEDGRPVAVSPGAEPLTDEMIRETLESIRR
ncbi:MAG: AbrB/MazE/SpoVT family DNA-binding domain-containing protein [Actinomycetales bacterium]